MDTITLNVPPSVGLTDEQFYQLCIANEFWQLEISDKGELIIMSPTGGESGIRNANLTTDINLWNRQTKLGKVFDSSTEFKLPSGAFRCPDVAWIKLERWEALTPEQKKKFPPICPDFVLELPSESDSLGKFRQKMQEYQANGVRLAWLIDPQTPLVEIYRQDQEVEIINFTFDNPPQLSGEDVLPGFVLDLTLIFNP
ncbi:MAG TPA: Uma2 family endonuclease [Nostocaceae cyanobacterium]|nr:Uma2 family endonuclease [Nostocaceae cyanobacterium]